MSEFEQWFNSEFPDADLSQHETLKGYNNLKFGWNAALSSLQGEQAAKIAELEAKLAQVEKDAERYRMLRSLDVTPYNKWDKVQELLHRAIDSADTIEMVDTAVDAAIQENKKGGAV